MIFHRTFLLKLIPEPLFCWGVCSEFCWFSPDAVGFLLCNLGLWDRQVRHKWVWWCCWWNQFWLPNAVLFALCHFGPLFLPFCELSIWWPMYSLELQPHEVVYSYILRLDWLIFGRILDHWVAIPRNEPMTQCANWQQGELWYLLISNDSLTWISNLQILWSCK